MTITPDDIAYAEKWRDHSLLARLLLTVHQHINDHDRERRYEALMAMKGHAESKATRNVPDPNVRETAQPMNVPPEPPVGTVVLDCDGDAWQRSHGDYSDGGGRWTGQGLVYSWGGLCRNYAPLTVLGPVPEPPPAAAVQWARTVHGDVDEHGLFVYTKAELSASRYILRMNGDGQ